MGEFQETATTEKEKYKDGCGCCGKYLFVDNKWVVVMVGNFRNEERVVLAEQGRQNNVCLVLSTGEMVDISNVGQEEVKLDKGTKLYEGNRLEYVRPDSLHKKELEFNQLIIPKGTFYHLVLSDGTKVWLNADSKIKYPVSFGQDKREVSLRGEGYFEVAKDSTRPFIVSTDKMDVRVLGTTFDSEHVRG